MIKYEQYDKPILEFLDTDIKHITYQYISPDDVFFNGRYAVAFIYLDNGEMLYGDDPKWSHAMVIKKYLDRLMELYPQLDDDSSHGLGRWDYLNERALLGRFGQYVEVSEMPKVVAFWSRDQEIYDKLLLPCLDRLLKDNVINNKTLISTPFIGATRQDKIRNVDQEESDNNLKKLENDKNVHLMNPDEKKKILAARGYEGGGKHPYQKASEDNKLVQPGQKWWSPTSEDISKLRDYDVPILEFYDDPDIIKYEYVNPDNLYLNGYDCKAFIYFPDGFILYGNDSDYTHNEIISLHKDEIMKRYPESEYAVLSNDFWKYFDNRSLMGRVGTEQEDHIVAFWATDNKLYDHNLLPCLERLLKDGVITNKTLISTPISGTISYNDIVSTQRDMSDDELKNHENIKNIHLAKQGEKKKLLAARGYEGGGKHQYQKASEDNKLVQPGQKWWASTSEDLERLHDYDWPILEFLDINNDRHLGEYLSPDDMYINSRLNTSFIYLPNGVMLYGNGIHYEIIEDNRKEILQMYPGCIGYMDDHDNTGVLDIEGLDIESTDYDCDIRGYLEEIALLGRCGVLHDNLKHVSNDNDFDINAKTKIVSFWSPHANVYTKLLKDCVDKLLSEGLIDNDSLISTPNTGTIHISNIIKNDMQYNDVSSDGLDKLQNAKNVHLMNPGEKKQTLAAAGYEGGGKHPYQKASEDNKLVQPGQKWWASTSESQLPNYDTILEFKNIFINPAYLLPAKDSISFIYFDNGTLLYEPRSEHRYMFSKYRDRIIKMYPDIAEHYEDGYQQSAIEKIALIGRSATLKKVRLCENGEAYFKHNAHTVSFWSDDFKLYDTMLVDCITQLYKHNIITDDTVISTPLLGTVKQANLKDGKRELTADELKKLKNAKNKHLMTPSEKKQALADDGYEGGGKHPYQKASEDNKLVLPGQKWWASTSENLEYIASMVD